MTETERKLLPPMRDMVTKIGDASDALSRLICGLHDGHAFSPAEISELGTDALFVLNNTALDAVSGWNRSLCNHLDDQREELRVWLAARNGGSPPDQRAPISPDDIAAAWETFAAKMWPVEVVVVDCREYTPALRAVLEQFIARRTPPAAEQWRAGDLYVTVAESRALAEAAELRRAEGNASAAADLQSLWDKLAFRAKPTEVRSER